MEVVVQWEEVIKAIEEATKSAASASPPFEESRPLIFQEYWRKIFNELRQVVSDDASIPEYLTEPPTSKFSVVFFDEMHPGRCPCCHPDVYPNVELERESGVTKDDLVMGITNALYGHTLPEIYREPTAHLTSPEDDTEKEAGGAKDQEEEDEEGQKDKGENEGGEEEKEEEYDDDEDESEEEIINSKGVVIYASCWMTGENDAGKRTAFGEEPTIFLYCCGIEEFENKRKKRMTRRASLDGM